MEVSAICCALKLERIDYISTKLPNILKVFKKILARLCRYMQNAKPMLKHFKFGIFFFPFSNREQPWQKSHQIVRFGNVHMEEIGVTYHPLGDAVCQEVCAADPFGSVASQGP